MAAGLAEELKKHFSIDAELIASGGGVFEVVKDGELIFSKKKLGRHAEENEVVNLIKG
ncbi:Rdx family protein [Candidatus Uabimicrobium amorphum]|uniref:Rdx family protein n=1 Tax=Uabimicrobium amorphum TaxID=2596890 RepID=UPI00125FEBFB